MAFRLELRFDSAIQLQGHLRRYAEQGGLILPERLCPGLGLPAAVELLFVLGERRALGQGTAQRRERLGVVVELSREALGDAFALLPKDLPEPREVPGAGSGVTLGRFSGTTGRLGQGPGNIQERVRLSAEAPGRDAEACGAEAADAGTAAASQATDKGVSAAAAAASQATDKEAAEEDAAADAGADAAGAGAAEVMEEALRPATITPLSPLNEAGLDALLSGRTPRWEGAEDEWAREPPTEGVPPALRGPGRKSSATPGG